MVAYTASGVKRCRRQRRSGASAITSTDAARTSNVKGASTTSWNPSHRPPVVVDSTDSSPRPRVHETSLNPAAVLATGAAHSSTHGAVSSTQRAAVQSGRANAAPPVPLYAQPTDDDYDDDDNSSVNAVVVAAPSATAVPLAPLYAEPTEDEGGNAVDMSTSTDTTKAAIPLVEVPVYALPDNYDSSTEAVVVASATKHRAMPDGGRKESTAMEPSRAAAVVHDDADGYALPTALQCAPDADPIYNDAASIDGE